MRTIYKYTLAPTDIQTVSLPKDCHPLCVKCQGNELVIYVMVDPHPDIERVDYLVTILGTGQMFESSSSLGFYLGTALMQGGSLVWHTFIRKA